MILDDVIAACDALNLSYGPPRGEPVGNISMSCPLAAQRHGDANDTNLSCSVSYGEGRSLAYCFSSNCGFRGSFIRLLREAVRGRPADKQIDELVQRLAPSEKFDLAAEAHAVEASFDPPAAEPTKEKFDPTVLPEWTLDAFSKEYHPYAAFRRISPAAWVRWGLCYDSYRQRIVFPVRRADGKLVGLCGRDVTGTADRKYHNYVGLKRSTILFGEDHFRLDTPIVLVEGPVDAVLVEEATGIPAGASLGEGFSKAQVTTICEMRPPYVIMFPDNDSAGRLHALKMTCALYERTMLLQITYPPEEKDPGDLTPEEIRVCVGNAQIVLDPLRS